MTLPFSWPEWRRMDAVDLSSYIQSRQVTVGQVSAQAAAAIERVNPHINAVLEVFDDVVLSNQPQETAARSPLGGVPMLMKDSGSAMRGRLREWGSRLSAGQRPAHDCPLTVNLRNAGLNLIGRTTLPESGKALDTSFDYQGTLVVTRNPWDLMKTPGGSSGGSAAAVASGAVPLARAGDAAGSTRIPAAFTGLVGHKPTRGLLPPPRGTNELTNHRIQEGVLTRTVRDQAAALDVMIGRRPMSHFIAARLPDSTYLDQIESPPRRPLRIAVSTGSWGLPGSCSPSVAQRVLDISDLLTDVLGHHIEPVDDGQICEWNSFWPSVRVNWLSSAWYWRSEAHRRGWPIDRVRAMLTPQNANLLNASEELTVADIQQSLSQNPQLMMSLAGLFEKYDLLICPAFPADVPLANGPFSLFADVPFSSWFSNLLHGIRYTVLGNESGIPSLCIPTGVSSDMPVGILLYGPPLSDGLLLQVGAQLEDALADKWRHVPRISVTL